MLGALVSEFGKARDRRFETLLAKAARRVATRIPTDVKDLHRILETGIGLLEPAPISSKLEVPSAIGYIAYM
jgi:hypothetical protein